MGSAFYSSIYGRLSITYGKRLVPDIEWNWVLKKLGAVVATNYVYFNPVTTILFAWAILSEQITVWFLLGTVLILVGMYLADRKKK